MDTVCCLLGRNIRELRREQQLSQERLAEMAGISANYLGLMERGGREPSVSTLVEISKALKIDIARLFEFEVSAGRSLHLIKLSNLLKGATRWQISLLYEIARVLLAAKRTR